MELEQTFDWGAGISRAVCWSVGMTPRTQGFDFTIPCRSGNRERLDLTPF
jgi:hypothetical protein